MSQMTRECREARPLLVARADRTLTRDQAARVDAHVTGCDDCRRELELLRAETGLLRADPMPAAPAGLAGRVSAELRVGPRRSPARRVLWRVAATVLFAAGVTVGALAGNAISRPVPDETDRVAPTALLSRLEEGL